MALYDSDVLIWYTRGHRPAGELLNADPEVALSLITLLEVYQGARNRVELQNLQREIPRLVWRVMPLTPEIGERAVEICTAFHLQVALSLADCLIAATALEHGVPLVTGNVKHYRLIRGLKLHAFVA
jgi:predicted nucleic acid-binding protein